MNNCTSIIPQICLFAKEEHSVPFQLNLQQETNKKVEMLSTGKPGVTSAVVCGETVKLLTNFKK